MTFNQIAKDAKMRPALGGSNAVGNHAGDCQSHAGELLEVDLVAQEGPAAQQHQHGLAVPQHLHNPGQPCHTM